MAKISIKDKFIEIELSQRQKLILARSNLVLELDRIKSATVVPKPKQAKLGKKTSGKFLFAGPQGTYTLGSKKLIVVGNSKKYLKLELHHPTIDEIWVGSGKPEVYLAQINSLK